MVKLSNLGQKILKNAKKLKNSDSTGQGVGVAGAQAGSELAGCASKFMDPIHETMTLYDESK